MRPDPEPYDQETDFCWFYERGADKPCGAPLWGGFNLAAINLRSDPADPAEAGTLTGCQKHLEQVRSALVDLIAISNFADNGGDFRRLVTP